MLSESDTGAFVLAAWFFGMTVAMGWVMAPATEAVVSAVPAAKTGVASATNTVARMISGALGVAVIGSLLSSLYAREIDGSLSALPPEAQARAEESVGAASGSPASSRRVRPPRCGTGRGMPSRTRWAPASWSAPCSRPRWP
jgi:hypothetical protein